MKTYMSLERPIVEMKKLNKFQTFVLCMGGLLVLVGAMLNPVESLVAVYVYCVGALMFVAMQRLESYEGDSFVVRRLRRQQIVGGLLLLLSGVAMFGQEYHIMYMQHNEWLIILLIAAMLELYTSFRIPAEIEKENKKEE